jgi:hypothetical protein
MTDKKMKNRTRLRRLPKTQIPDYCSDKEKIAAPAPTGAAIKPRF